MQVEDTVTESPESRAKTFADRTTGQVFPDGRAMVDAYIDRFVSAHEGCTLPPLDETGYTQLRRGSASVGVNVLDDHGVLLFLAPGIPGVTAGRETFYRTLLELSSLPTSHPYRGA